MLRKSTCSNGVRHLNLGLIVSGFIISFRLEAASAQNSIKLVCGSTFQVDFGVGRVLPDGSLSKETSSQGPHSFVSERRELLDLILSQRSVELILPSSRRSEAGLVVLRLR